jgi:hypothetical protein
LREKTKTKNKEKEEKETEEKLKGWGCLTFQLSPPVDPVSYILFYSQGKRGSLVINVL